MRKCNLISNNRPTKQIHHFVRMMVLLNLKLQTIESDQLAGPLGKVARHFGPPRERRMGHHDEVTRRWCCMNDVYPHLHCPTQLALSLLASQLSTFTGTLPGIGSLPPEDMTLSIDTFLTNS